MLLSSIIGISQTNKGNWLLGGTAGFTSSKYGDAKNTIIDLSPNAGYFVINNLAIALSAHVGSETYNSGLSGASDEKSSSIYIGPTVRYYFTPVGKNVKLFGEASCAFGSSKFDAVSVSTTAWGVSAGPAFFLNKNVALEISLGYASSKNQDDNKSTNLFGLRAGFQIHL